MSSGASIATIKAGLIAAYQAISLPGGLGTPNAIGRELDGSPPSVPYVEVHTNPTRTISQPRGADSYEVTRLFVVRLYVGALVDETPSIEDSDYIKAENCAEPVADYFHFTEPRLNVSGVITHQFTADTAGAAFPTRDNNLQVGIAFQHLITYTRQR